MHSVQISIEIVAVSERITYFLLGEESSITKRLAKNKESIDNNDEIVNQAAALLMDNCVIMVPGALALLRSAHVSVIFITFAVHPMHIFQKLLMPLIPCRFQCASSINQIV
jgi:hypothetical protein